MPEEAETIRESGKTRGAEWFSGLRPIVASLPARHRTLVELVYVEGCTLAEVARRMGISRPSATEIHKNVLHTLTKQLLVVRI